MTIRPIQNSDLKVTKHDWWDTRNRQRVHVSLQDCSVVNKTYWLNEADQAKPETLARVKSDMHKIALTKLSGLRKYIV